MFQFNILEEPPTNNELKEIRDRLKMGRKTQIKMSCLSDLLHGLIFIFLYYRDILSGYAVLTALVLSTVSAIIVAATSRRQLRKADHAAIGVMTLATAMAVGFTLAGPLKQTMNGSIIAGLAGASIVIMGATLGRRIKQVMMTLESLKPIIDDDVASHELRCLCRNYPELEQYRQQAARLLRPNLTYGELTAMRHWVEEKISSSEH